MPEYRRTIDGIGVEDLYTDGEKPVATETLQTNLSLLENLRRESKPVVVIEYCRNKTLRQRSADSARRQGFVLLITDREMKSLGVSGGVRP